MPCFLRWYLREYLSAYTLRHTWHLNGCPSWLLSWTRKAERLVNLAGHQSQIKSSLLESPLFVFRDSNSGVAESLLMCSLRCLLRFWQLENFFWQVRHLSPSVALSSSCLCARDLFFVFLSSSPILLLFSSRRISLSLLLLSLTTASSLSLDSESPRKQSLSTSSSDSSSSSSSSPPDWQPLSPSLSSTSSSSITGTFSPLLLCLLRWARTWVKSLDLLGQRLWHRKHLCKIFLSATTSVFFFCSCCISMILERLFSSSAASSVLRRQRSASSSSSALSVAEIERENFYFYGKTFQFPFKQNKKP